MQKSHSYRETLVIKVYFFSHSQSTLEKLGYANGSSLKGAKNDREIGQSVTNIDPKNPPDVAGKIWSVYDGRTSKSGITLD